MITISLAPSIGSFYTFRAYADGQIVIDTAGTGGAWHGDAEDIEVQVDGVRGSTFACSVTGTSKKGVPLNHKATHTLDKNGDFDETLP